MFKKDLPVYTALVLMLFVAILFLTACVGSPHPTHSLSNPSMTPLSEPVAEEPVEREPVEQAPDTEVKELLIEAAYGVCEIFDLMDPIIAIPSIKDMGADSGLTSEEIDGIIQLAAMGYCPEYESEVQRYYR